MFERCLPKSRAADDCFYALLISSQNTFSITRFGSQQSVAATSYSHIWLIKLSSSIGFHPLAD